MGLPYTGSTQVGQMAMRAASENLVTQPVNWAARVLWLWRKDIQGAAHWRASSSANINAKPRPFALFYFGNMDTDSETVLKDTTSGNIGTSNPLPHVAMDDLLFSGVGPSGVGTYHGIEGLLSVSDTKEVFVQSCRSLLSLQRAPFDKLPEFVTAIRPQR